MTVQIQQRSGEVIRDVLRTIRAQLLGMWRYRWVSIVIAWLVCTAGWAAVYMMPNIYEANARVFVDTENAIEDFLGGIAAPTDVMNEVALVVREMVSRPNLAEVARSTDLALRAETPAQFEDLLTSLQERISVAGNREGVYSISFEDADRNKALAVVETLLTTFVERSLGADRTDSAQAQQFLRGQIMEYEQRLTDAEDRLAEFKRENVKFMPDQRGDYFSRMQSAESDFLVTEAKLNLATERRAELLRQIEGEAPVFGIMSPTRTASAGGYAFRKIRDLELQLDELRLQYTDKHPRIGQILDTIELLKRQETTERQQRIESAASQPLLQNPLDLNPVYQNMRIQLSNVEVEIASLRAESNQRRREVAQLRTLVDTIPQVEAELNRLNRDYNVVKAKHQQLLQQLETANIGEDVSRSIDEIQFRIIEPPFSGITPVGPNRPFFLAIVLVAGIGAAIGAGFLLNQLNPTFVGNRSVTEVLGIPVLSAVSLLQTTEEIRAERNGRYALQAAGILLFASFTVVILYADLGAGLLRNFVGSMS